MEKGLIVLSQLPHFDDEKDEEETHAKALRRKEVSMKQIFTSWIM